MDRNAREPYLMQATPEWDPAAELELRQAENPLPNGTLGDIGLATEVVGPDEFPLTILIQPVDPRELVGIDMTSVRAFRWDESRTLQPIWNSGVNLGLGFIWTKIRRRGIYVPVGLPRDRLLQEALRSMARERRLADVDSPEQMQSLTEPFLRPFSEAPAEAVEELREFVARLEVRTGLRDFLPGEVNLRQGGHVGAFPLPRNATLEEFKERLGALDWDTLQDAWATTVGPDGVARYTTTNPPMYRSDEAGLSSPGVVNDVVFVSTSKPALYALDATRGQCLWSAPSIPEGDPREPTFALGPAIYGNYVVLGAWNNVYIYRLPAAWLARPRETVDFGTELTLGWPPDPRILELIRGIPDGT